MLMWTIDKWAALVSGAPSLTERWFPPIIHKSQCLDQPMEVQQSRLACIINSLRYIALLSSETKARLLSSLLYVQPEDGGTGNQVLRSTRQWASHHVLHWQLDGQCGHGSSCSMSIRLLTLTCYLRHRSSTTSLAMAALTMMTSRSRTETVVDSR